MNQTQIEKGVDEFTDEEAARVLKASQAVINMLAVLCPEPHTALKSLGVVAGYVVANSSTDFKTAKENLKTFGQMTVDMLQEVDFSDLDEEEQADLMGDAEKSVKH